MAGESAPALVLYGKPGCCLCEEAALVIERVVAQFGLTLSKRSILQDPDAFARYRYRIPVLTLDGLVLEEGRIGEAGLRRALDDALRSRGRDGIAGAST